MAQNFTIYQGETLSLPFFWYDGELVVKAITAATRAYPPVITSAAHGLPASKIPVRISGVVGMEELNLLAKVYALKVDANTLSLPDIDASGFSAYESGGYVSYRPPKNLEGYTARMQLRSSLQSDVVILELTDENGRLVIGGDEGTVSVVLTATDTAALAFSKAVYDLELESSSGVVKRLASGVITLSKEVTR